MRESEEALIARFLSDGYYNNSWKNKKSFSKLDGDQDQEEIEANSQGQEEVEAQVEDAQEVICPPHRFTRNKFKQLGNSGRLFSLFIVSFVLKGA